MGRVRETTGPFPYATAAEVFDFGERIGIALRAKNGTRTAIAFGLTELLELKGLERTDG